MTTGFDVFIDNILAFPTIIFTGVLFFCLLYWLTSLLGMADMDSFDIDIPDGLDVGGDGIGGSNLGFFTSILFKFGLYGVPLVLILSIFGVVAWVVSYLLMEVVVGFVSGILIYVLGVAVLCITLYISAWITGKAIAPFRKISEKRPKQNAKNNLGKVAIVRTSEVNEPFGEVVLEDGGAGLILKVRSTAHIFQRGDKVVLLDYIAENNTYTVISEAEFNHG